jgi:hypothetical protein
VQHQVVEPIEKNLACGDIGMSHQLDVSCCYN